MAKYIFVVGGVISGTGKGVAAASIGLLLRLRGHNITLVKFDPYYNINAGILGPGEHGECFLCDDGTETDLDLGHYERFIDEELTRNSSVTTGQIYLSVIEKERE